MYPGQRMRDLAPLHVRIPQRGRTLPHVRIPQQMTIPLHVRTPQQVKILPQVMNLQMGVKI
jgi:hypothetical protein